MNSNFQYYYWLFLFVLLTCRDRNLYFTLWYTTEVVTLPAVLNFISTDCLFS
jgi:hypothetical protein